MSQQPPSPVNKNSRKCPKCGHMIDAAEFTCPGCGDFFWGAIWGGVSGAILSFAILTVASYFAFKSGSIFWIILAVLLDFVLGLSGLVMILTAWQKVKGHYSKSAKKAKPNEHYMLKCNECDFTHHIPGDVTDQTVSFFVKPDEGKMACVYGGGSFNVTLEVKDFFTIINVPKSGQVLYSSIRDNMKPLHNHMMLHYDPLFLIIQQSSDQTIHKYRKTPEGDQFIKFSKQHGADMVGNIDISKAEIPEISW